MNDVAGADVPGYIRTDIRALLANLNCMGALAGLLLPDAASRRRRSLNDARLLRAVYSPTV